MPEDSVLASSLDAETSGVSSAAGVSVTADADEDDEDALLSAVVSFVHPTAVHSRIPESSTPIILRFILFPFCFA